MSKFTNGQTVYTEHGQECIYVAESGGLHIVRDVYETQSGNKVFGDLFSKQTVFSEPPVPIIHRQIAELEAILTAKSKELSSINGQIHELNREQKDRMARLKQHEALKNLDDFLAGKITHMVVVLFGSVTVQTVGQALKSNNERFDRDLKLLTLYGCAKGDLQFRISHYSDGSGGGYTEAYPFTNEDDAKAFAKQLVEQKLGECISGKNGKNGAGIPVGLDAWIKMAEVYGVPVPADMTDLLRRYGKTVAEGAVAKARTELAEAESRLASLSENDRG